MAEKPPKKPINKDAWMNTYSDMVTLLLCFFVLLFATSSVDQSKWEILVQTLNPKASDKMSQIVTADIESTGKDPFDQGGDSMMKGVENFQDLYYAMEQYVTENNLEGKVEVEQGEGYTFITFRNHVLFDGDSYVLKPRGNDILKFLCTGLAPINEEIKEIKVYGHTNQADPNRPNAVRGDRFLSSNRGAEVVTFIQEQNIISPQKLTEQSYGQHYPIASFITEEDRAKNRRVEILITKTGSLEVSLEQIYAQIDGKNTEVAVPEGQGATGEPQ